MKNSRFRVSSFKFHRMTLPLVLILSLLLGSFSLVGRQVGAQTQDGATPRLKYPETKKVDVVDDYFGTKVADPYRWLEDGHL